MKTNICKICGREPNIEISERGDGYYVSCVMDLNSDNPHYINMIDSTKDKALGKWNLLMTGARH